MKHSHPQSSRGEIRQRTGVTFVIAALVVTAFTLPPPTAWAAPSDEWYRCRTAIKSSPAVQTQQCQVDISSLKAGSDGLCSFTISCTVPDYWPWKPGKQVTAYPSNQTREQVRNGMFCDTQHIVFPWDGSVVCNPMFATEQEFEQKVISQVIAIASEARNKYPAGWAEKNNRPHLERWDHFLNLVRQEKKYGAARAYAYPFTQKGWAPLIKVYDLRREWRVSS